MRAITLSQPWADLVVYGTKRIENRSLTLQGPARALIGQQVAIHAGRKVEIAVALLRGFTLPMQAGVLTGVATVKSVHVYPWSELPRDQDVWANGPLLIELADVRALPTPIPCRGFLGFWPLITEFEARLRAQLEPVEHPDGCNSVDTAERRNCQGDGHHACRTCTRHEVAP
jgi:hypothetical protein